MIHQFSHNFKCTVYNHEFSFLSDDGHSTSGTCILDTALLTVPWSINNWHKELLGSPFVSINMHTWSYSLTVIVINVKQEMGSKSHNMSVHCSTNHVVPLRHVCETTQYITICLCALFHCPCCFTQACMWNNPIYHNMSLCTVPPSMLSHSDMYVKWPNIYYISQYVCVLFHYPCCSTQTYETTQYISALTPIWDTIPVCPMWDLKLV